MEIQQLQYFKTLAKLEHMTRAAEVLMISQPALSKSISNIEKDLGVPLFNREGRSIYLNRFGEQFREAPLPWPARDCHPTQRMRAFPPFPDGKCCRSLFSSQANFHPRPRTGTALQ